jgi:hypothetical protein
MLIHRLQMTLASARESIIQKFTNYRNVILRRAQISNQTKQENSELLDAMKLAASALVDMKTFNKGRSLFKQRKESEILARRDELMNIDESLSQVGAYQKALKQLWATVDQDWWDAQAVGEMEDIHE